MSCGGGEGICHVIGVWFVVTGSALSSVVGGSLWPCVSVSEFERDRPPYPAAQLCRGALGEIDRTVEKAPVSALQVRHGTVGCPALAEIRSTRGMVLTCL